MDRFDFSALHEEYRDESQRQLALLDAALLRLEQSGDLPDEERTALLRALHTLKGNSGMLGLRPVVDTVHRVEAAFRSSRMQWSRETVDSMFEVAAALRRVCERIGTDRQNDALARLQSVAASIDPDPSNDEAPDETAGSSVRDAEGTAPDAAATAHTNESTATRLEAGVDAAEPTGKDTGTDLADVPDLAGAGAGELIRVPFGKLDTLLNRVAEMVTVGAALEALIERFGPELDKVGARRPFESQVESLQLSSDALREATMDLRLVPVARLFERFPRLARDLARAQAKKVHVVLEGEDEEMDKSTVDALADPILHLTRNAVDHGIEPPEERARLGKPEVGTITLRARRAGDRVLVEVSDDGRGLDRERILERARSDGTVGAQQELSRAEIDELIFRPGFSTRDQATVVSGRGVGLDVVKRRVTALRGTLSVDESPQGGTRFLLALPLTLAIVPALLFEASGAMMALPATEVEQTLRRVRTERVGGTEVIRVQDALVPVARAGRLLGWPDPDGVSTASFAIVLRRGNRSAALLADRLLEQREVVVKALPRMLGPVRAVSGATVTPGGQVVLLLDSGGLLDLNLDIFRRENRV